ncbi:MAG: Nitrous-oxide reductase accessory protein NosL [Ignavibacteria bacterium]|nr:Nitrous-oxide reductase accessory protein NosL [Ignavibacteria bacterium]
MITKTRVLMFIGILVLIPIYFLPIWSISLEAPQYPEGLGIYIHIDKITGHKEHDLESLNGLNHYIGMKRIEPESIPELKIMPYFIGFMLFLGFIAFIFDKKAITTVWIVIFLAGLIYGLYDFYLWEYDYGHNLNPKAAIKITGMAYQPPLIGSKQLLNFNAISWPYLGAYCAGFSLILFIISLFRKKNTKPSVQSGQPGTTAALVISAIVILSGVTGCAKEPQPIVLGSDACAHCKMTIVDSKWGAEIITDKGKIHKFDVVECMIAYKDKNLKDEKIHSLWTINYLNPGVFINAEHATYVRSLEFHSPMGLNAVSLVSKEEIPKLKLESKFDTLNWSELSKLALEE